VHPHVLSIQSHVTFGYVGNKAATLPMQLHGLHVDPLNTVNFATHGGYPVVKGWRTSPKQIDDVIDGLRSNGILDRYRFILSGYIGKADTIRSVASAVREIKDLRSKLSKETTFVCDPVLGDNGKLYVEEAAVEAYHEMLPLATMITPNGFETEVLSGVAPKSRDSARAAARFFHALGVRVVVIKSFVDEAAPRDGEHPLITLFASVADDAGHIEREHMVRVHEVEGYFTGTGDLFAAVLLAMWSKTCGDLAEALRFAVSVVLDVLNATAACGSPELTIIECVPNILHPQSVVDVC
jgi:pyridoxine kinase